MISFLKNLFRFPSITELPLKGYTVDFSLHRLAVGVDNIHYDVHLSPKFCKVVSDLISFLIVKNAQAELLIRPVKSELPKLRDKFSQYCREILKDAVNKAKAAREIQIDFLAQTAVVKLFLKEIRKQYELMTEQIKGMIRECELSNSPDRAMELKKELLRIQQNERSILYNTGEVLFEYFKEVQHRDIREIRELNFGEQTVISYHLFYNSLLYQDDPFDDQFMLKAYDILLGRRLEDPDKYDGLIATIKRILIKIFQKDSKFNSGSINSEQAKALWEQEIDKWLMNHDNVDILFNWIQTGHQYRTLKKQPSFQGRLSELRKQAQTQKKLLDFFYRELKPTGLVERIIAIYEMQPIYNEYCPPLVPQLVVQYLIEPSIRRTVENRLKRLKAFYKKDFSLKPLDDLSRKIRTTSRRIRKLYLMRFLKGFIRYHCAMRLYSLIQDGMETIRLIGGEKLLTLSRANRSLYEFLLEEERISEEKPIINHVIVKADIRGSTDITHRMLEKGLNPATYFSLNLFDPISAALAEYGAEKVFVEGDAIILSLFEHEDTPAEWYSVARSCGLALNILDIVRRCNAKCSEHHLPIIELGIGITYKQGSPVFLFDGRHRIMISSAINHADRLSGCSKLIRKQVDLIKSPFNLFVFQHLSEDVMSKTADDLFLRYNVNGAELSADAFNKLASEIELKKITFNLGNPEKETVTLFSGKFPTVSGQYQQLLIREARIPYVKSEKLEIEHLTDRTYYELCSDSRLYEHIRKLTIKNNLV